MPAKEKSKAVSLTLDQFANLDSFDAAASFLRENGVELRQIADLEEFLGDGFTYVEKGALVNIPFIVLDARHTMSPSYNAPMVTIRAMTATNKKVKFVDFGTGIRQQLANLAEKGVESRGVVAQRGVVASDYTIEDDNGDKIKATTYYLDLAR